MGLTSKSQGYSLRSLNALGFVGLTHQPPLYLFALQKKRKKKREKKREKKKEKKRFPIKGGKLKQVGNENFSPQGWKNGHCGIAYDIKIKESVLLSRCEPQKQRNKQGK